MSTKTLAVNHTHGIIQGKYAKKHWIYGKKALPYKIGIMFIFSVELMNDPL